MHQAFQEAPTQSFATRVEEISAQRSSFCFGCDPSREVLADWGLPYSVSGLSDFVSIALDAAVGTVGIIKPQVAFYEPFGPEGMTQLKRLISEAKAQGLAVIADAKRTDIGHSVAAYADAWLGEGPGFGADAVTATAYLGGNSLIPMYERAAATGCGVFVVVRSSNPEGAELQSADMGGMAVADHLAQTICLQNTRLCHDQPVGPIGAVIGATLGNAAAATIANLPNSLFLVPGVGAQGASLQDVRELFGRAAHRAIPSASRSVLAAGPSSASLKMALKSQVEEAFKLRRD
jgi:orotidine-5'-phosphate decarboxylase